MKVKNNIHVLNKTPTELIYDIVSAIKPHDVLEKEHIAENSYQKILN